MSQNLRATLALVVLTLIWGYSWVTAKLALQYVAPFAFSAQRAMIGATALLAALVIMRRPLRPRLPWLVALNGMLQTTLFLCLQSWSLVEGGAGKTSVLIFTAPIWTLFLAWPLLGERIRGSQWLAAATTLIGLVLIIAPWQLEASPLAKILGVLTAMTWAASTIIVKRVSRHGLDMMNFNAWQMTLGAVLLIAVSAGVPEPATRWSGEYLGLLLFTSLISTGLGWFLWFYILERLPAWEASLSVLGVPVVATIASRLQLGETSSGIELAGMLLIGTGLTLLSVFNWRQQRRAAP
ncbi:MAG: EamA family transporter [Betaproteobacteria bacterium]|nr:EamA family transporter [Betaproteobacteria bacterium]